jgi:hypothetical protein
MLFFIHNIILTTLIDWDAVVIVGDDDAVPDLGLSKLLLFFVSSIMIFHLLFARLRSTFPFSVQGF